MDIVVRPLTKEESEYFCSSNFWGKHFRPLGQLSVMATADHPVISKVIHIKQKWRRSHLGGGQYIDELIGHVPDAPTGRVIQIVFGLDAPMSYMLGAANELGIACAYQERHQAGSFPVYFQRIYAEVFADCFKYIDHALHKRYCSMNFFSQFFLGSLPAGGTKESMELLNSAKRIIGSVR